MATPDHVVRARIYERALRRAYTIRSYPGLLWEGASELGREQAQRDIAPEDVLAVVESMLVTGELVHHDPSPADRGDQP